MNILFNIIDQNEYVNKCYSRKIKNINSLTYLIDRDLSQSDCIKLGIALEKVLCETILKLTNLENIKQPNSKGSKEKDFLFKDDNNNVIYYGELKTNLNLDTEKLPYTIDKIKNIYNELKINYPTYKIIWVLISGRFINRTDIPKCILKKYLQIKDNIVGINDFLQLLNIEFRFDNDSYKEYLNYLSNAMFNNS